MPPMRSRGRSRGWGALIRPGAGGLLLALAFPPWGLWPLVFAAWVPLWVDLEARARSGDAGWRRTFLCGWVMGFVAFAAILYWILGLSNEEVTIPGLMLPALALLALYVALFFGAAAALSSWISRRTGAPLLLLAPAITLFFEWLRGQGPLGFPWGAPAYALARVTPLLQPAAATGFWGLVFLVLLVNALLGAFLCGRRLGLPIALALLAVWWIQGEGVLSRHPEGSAAEGRRPLKVLVAQPDIRREVKWKPEHRGEVIASVMSHARAAAARGDAGGGFDLLVWPETVFPVVLMQDPNLRPQVEAFVDSIGRPVLLGTQEITWPIREGRREFAYYNSALVLGPGADYSPLYRKIKLVPFSERMPLQQLFPWLTQIDFGQSNFSAGEEPVLFTVGGEQAGCLICFESVFPELSAEMIRGGASLLVNITNDFWFGRTAAPIQHAEMAILRAVENRVPLVRCANTGVSFVVDPWGRVREERPMFVAADFVATVACGAGSFSARHPDWIRWPWLAWIAAAVAIGFVRGSARPAGRRAEREEERSR